MTLCGTIIWLDEFLAFCPAVALLRLWYRGSRGAEGAQALARRRGGCLSEGCHSPQRGRTPLHFAAENGHVAVVEPLLAAEAAVDATDKVRGGGGGVGEGWVAAHSSACTLDFLCASQHWVEA